MKCYIMVLVVGLVVNSGAICLGESLTITSTGGTLPKDYGLSSYSPMIELSYSGLKERDYVLKVWLLNRGPWYCASGSWCESSYSIKNSDGTNASGKLQIVKNMDVYSYTNLDWVARLYYNGSQVTWDEHYLSASSNKPPVLSQIENKNTHIGGGVTFEVDASDPEGSEITYTISNLPDGAIFENKIFTWVPEAEGNYKVIVHANDGITYDSQEVFINVGLYPDLEFGPVNIPLCGSTDNITGTVIGGDNYESFRVFSYIFIGGYGWVTKPYADSPKTGIDSNGNFEIDIATGGIDDLATIVYLGICHKDVDVPVLANGSGIPAINELFSQKFYRDPTDCHRTIAWSGQEWWVKDSRGGTLGPGQNYFSSSSDNVFVDTEGNLHLKMVNDSGIWTCPEIVSLNSFGYGIYNFALKENPALASNVTFGAFTWEDDVPQFNSREIDLELAYWGVASDPFGQFVVQPWNKTENRYRFEVPESDGPYLYSFKWQEESITGLGLTSPARLPVQGDIFTEWTYEGSDNPQKGLENVRFNLWLSEGTSPANGLEQEVVVESFNHYSATDYQELKIEASDHGSVIASSIQGLDSFYPYGSVVNLTAIPDPAYSLTAWIGADENCTCVNNTVTIGSTNEVTALFSKDVIYRTLTLVQAEHGLVEALECVEGECPEGTVVSLTAYPDPGYSLTGWTGTDNNSAGVHNTVTLGEVNVVSAAFTQKTPMSFTSVRVKASRERQPPRDSILIRGILPDFNSSMVSHTVTVDIEDIHFEFDVAISGSKARGRLNNNYLVMDLKKNSFTFFANKIDLSGLTSPIFIVFATDKYNAVGTADESVINGKNAIPAGLLMGIEDSLSISKANVGKNGISLSGGIAFASFNPSLSNMNLTINDTTEALGLTGKNGFFRYKRPKDGEGMVRSFSVNLRTYTYKLILDPAAVWNAAETEAVTIDLFSDNFSLTTHADLTGLQAVVDSLRGEIMFTHVPPRGSFSYLNGKVKGVSSQKYGVAVYIQVDGVWWQKPMWASPVTPIRGGKWSCDITTGGIDSTANAVLAFLIPKTFDPPYRPTSEMYIDFPYVHQGR